MSAASRWLPVAGIALAAGAFAWLNRGEVVMLNLGLFRLPRVPLSVFFFLAFLFGMLSMLLLSLRQDLRTRRLLRDHGLLDAAPSPAPPAPATTASAPMPVREPDPDRTAAYPRDYGVHRLDDTEAM